mmetsp:Transcript_65725/g.213911  ORF Transcript_65725/g.213911 Transcript_65725/m.213911 type:complete len:239 (-) Transcript_65725:1603-2319(-)
MFVQVLQVRPSPSPQPSRAHQTLCSWCPEVVRESCSELLDGLLARRFLHHHNVRPLLSLWAQLPWGTCAQQLRPWHCLLLRPSPSGFQCQALLLRRIQHRVSRPARRVELELPDHRNWHRHSHGARSTCPCSQCPPASLETRVPPLRRVHHGRFARCPSWNCHHRIHHRSPGRIRAQIAAGLDGRYHLQHHVHSACWPRSPRLPVLWSRLAMTPCFSAHPSPPRRAPPSRSVLFPPRR